MTNSLPSILKLLTAANAALFIALTVLLLGTLAKQHLVMHSRVYLLASMLGLLGCIAFAGLATRLLPPYVGPLSPDLGLIVIVLLPSALMTEAGLLGLLGASGFWRVPFLIPAAFGGVVFVRLISQLSSTWR